jgi:hypothetical protein
MSCRDFLDFGTSEFGECRLVAAFDKDNVFGTLFGSCPTAGLNIPDFGGEEIKDDDEIAGRAKME